MAAGRDCVYPDSVAERPRTPKHPYVRSRHLTQTHINSMLQLHSLPKMRKHRKDQPHVIAQVVKAARIKAFAQREEWEKIRENYSLL